MNETLIKLIYKWNKVKWKWYWENKINYNEFIEIKHNLKSLTDDGIKNVLISILGI